MKSNENKIMEDMNKKAPLLPILSPPPRRGSIFSTLKSSKKVGLDYIEINKRASKSPRQQKQYIGEDFEEMEKKRKMQETLQLQRNMAVM